MSPYFNTCLKISMAAILHTSFAVTWIFQKYAFSVLYYMYILKYYVYKNLGKYFDIYLLKPYLSIYMLCVTRKKEFVHFGYFLYFFFFLPAKFESKYFAVEKYFMHIIFTEFFFLFFQVLKVSWENQLYHLHIVL